MAEKTKLYATNISCQHCAMTIKREVEPLDGVHVVNVDVPNKIVSLEYEDDAALKQAMDTLEDIGYPAEEVS